jgi:Kef-type K+ transport system membrane component KefB
MEFTSFLSSLLVIYIAARLCGELAARMGQSPVLGELLAGVLVGGSGFGWIEQTEVLKLLSEVGVVLLLFEVGLESDLASFLKVGVSAALVAIIGVVIPFILGYGVAIVLHRSQMQSLFVGATLTATSVAITARVLHDMGRLNTTTGHIILGAAVLDDILGLVILAGLLGLAESGTVSWGTIGWPAAMSVLLLSIALLAGVWSSSMLTRILHAMKTRGSLVIAATSFALLFAYFAGQLGVAPLVGAFAAGLILARTEHHAHIREQIKPVVDLFSPIFFVMVGVAVQMSVLNPLDPQNRSTVLLAGGLTLAAIIGKLVSGLGVLGGRVNRWAVGIGMVPRGEVGLIFAGIGLSSHVLGQGDYTAVLLVVTVTTLLAPVLLKFAMERTEEMN